MQLAASGLQRCTITVCLVLSISTLALWQCDSPVQEHSILITMLPVMLDCSTLLTCLRLAKLCNVGKAKRHLGQLLELLCLFLLLQLADTAPQKLTVADSQH